MDKPFEMAAPRGEPIEAAGVFFDKQIIGATCDVCGKELFDKKNMKEHYKIDHPDLRFNNNGTE